MDQKATEMATADGVLDGVVNVLTAIPARLNPRRFAKESALTNRLRVHATSNLVGGAFRVAEQGG